MRRLFENTSEEEPQEEKNESTKEAGQPFWSDKHIAKTIKILRNFYLTFGILIVCSAIGIGVLQPDQLEPSLPTLIVALIICFSFYYGFQQRGHWVVPVMVFLSSVAVIRLIFYQPPDVMPVLLRMVGFAFQLFLLYFFTKKEVRAYFKSQGGFLV